MSTIPGINSGIQNAALIRQTGTLRSNEQTAPPQSNLNVPNRTGSASSSDSVKSQTFKLLSMLMAVLAAKVGKRNKKQAATGNTPSAPAGNSQAAKTSGGGGKLNIAQIDDFSTDKSGFNHGKEIAKTLNSDGNANLQQYDISGGGDRTQKISNALDDVLARVRNGERIDAVNIPQVSASDGPAAQAIRNKIEQLYKAGVPVTVASGNNGPGQENFLESAHSFNVENTVNGRVSAQSGRGNVRAEGRTTSFASANLTRQIAEMKANGSSIDQIFSQLA